MTGVNFFWALAGAENMAKIIQPVMESKSSDFDRDALTVSLQAVIKYGSRVPESELARMMPGMENAYENMLLAGAKLMLEEVEEHGDALSTQDLEPGLDLMITFSIWRSKHAGSITLPEPPAEPMPPELR